MTEPKTHAEQQLQLQDERRRARRFLKRRRRGQMCCVVSEDVAFCLAFIEIGIILASFTVAYLVYPEILEIENEKERAEWQFFFWCLIVANFLAILGSVGWAYGVKSRQLEMFFWPWILFSLMEFVLLVSIVAGLFFMHYVKSRVFFIPFVLLSLPALFSIGYYQDSIVDEQRRTMSISGP